MTWLGFEQFTGKTRRTAVSSNASTRSSRFRLALRRVDPIVVECDVLDDRFSAIDRDPVDEGDDAFAAFVGTPVLGCAIDAIALLAATLALSIASASDEASMVRLS